MNDRFGMRFPLGILRRCHPVRCIRFGLVLIFAIVLITSLWQYATSTSKQHGKSVEDDVQDQSVRSDDHHPRSKSARHNRRQSHVRSNHLAVSRDKIDRGVQSQLDYIGSHLDVRYTILGNEGGKYYIDVTLSNRGQTAIESCCWAIYLYHTKFLDVYSFNSGTPMRMMNERRHVEENPDGVTFTLEHVNGYTFRLQPTNRFVGLEPGEQVVLRLGGGGWAVSRSEVIPNWYVANDYSPSEPRLLRATAGEEMKFVGDFDPSKRWSRTEDDACVPFTPDDRYARNKVPDLGSDSGSIIPTPLSIQFKKDAKKLRLHGSSWMVLYTPGLENEAQYIQERLNLSSLKSTEISRAIGKAQCRTNAITLHLSDKMPSTVVSESLEKYVLVVGAKKDCISIFGPSAAGVFRGITSLLSLSSRGEDGTSTLPGVIVVDAPRFPYRGVMVDVVRHFHTKEELLQLMRAMAMYKMNKLHLHLADDEGWRLEIPGLDELTKFGGVRGHAFRELSHVLSLLGSGPFTNSSGSGFYTVSDYQEILRFAKSHHIEIIPEFDMPGHSHAAIKSMEARYARLMATGDETEAMRYLLSDLADRSSYLSGQFYKDSAINPCIESSYRFVEHIVREVKNLHKDILPLKVFHFGGDEVPQEAYSGSPACAEFLRSHKKLSSSKDLKAYFVRRAAMIVARYDLSPMGWEDAFTNANGMPVSVTELQSKEVISAAWYNTWESGLAHRAYEYANGGYKVVLSPTTHFYYDNPQEPDPEDWGLHWATRYINTKRSFNFMPDSIYDSIDYDFWGRTISKMDLCNFDRVRCDPLRSPENVLGIEAVMWSELIRTPERMDWMLWPRLLALAERSWHKASWESIDVVSKRLLMRKEDWMNFSNAVGYKELRRLEELGVSYYLPRPGARLRSGKLWVNTAFPGLIVQVSNDDGQTWKDYDETVKYSGHLLLATRSHNGMRRSVPVAVDA